MMPHEMAAAEFDQLPELSPEVQFELAFLLLDELELEPDDVRRLNSLISQGGTTLPPSSSEDG